MTQAAARCEKKNKKQQQQRKKEKKAKTPKRGTPATEKNLSVSSSNGIQGSESWISRHNITTSYNIGGGSGYAQRLRFRAM